MIRMRVTRSATFQARAKHVAASVVPVTVSAVGSALRVRVTSWRKMTTRDLFVVIVVTCTTYGCVRGDSSVTERPLDPSLVSLPSLELGSSDEIENPGWATLLPDRRVAVADQFASHIAVFDTSGTLVQTIGRKGFGPGEFQAPIWTSTCARDSLYVWDGFQGRMSVFDLRGTHRRSFVIAYSVNRIACSADRLFVVTPPSGPNIRRRPGEKRRVRWGELVAVDFNGDIKKSFGNVSLPLSEPLGPYTTIAASSKFVFVGTADSPFVDVYSHSGKARKVVALGLKPRRATQELKDQEMVRLLANLGDERTRQENRERYNQFPLPEFMPAYSKIVADAYGHIWAILSGRGEGPTILRRVDIDQSEPTDIQLQYAVNIFEIGIANILGSYDVNGQPRVGLFTLPPRGSQK